MKFSLLFELQMPKPWSAGAERDCYMQALDQIKLADEVGFHTTWSVEHHFLTEYAHSSAPEVFLSAVAQHTKNIRIGHGVVLLPFNYNHPLRVAERVGALDIMSNGRVEFGTGRSTTTAELGGFGIDPEGTRAQWEEGLEVVLKAWKDEPIKHDGELLSIPEREVWPKPVQKPHPPLWMAATSPDTFKIAGAKGLGVLCFQLSEKGLKLAHDNYRGAIKNAEPVGEYVNENFAALALTHCGKHADTVETGARGAQWFMQKVVEILIGLKDSDSYEYLKDMIDLDHQPKDAALEDLMQHPLIVTGGADECIEKLEKVAAYGADEIICFHQFGRVPHARIMESLQIFGEEIIPHFKASQPLSPKAAATV